MSAVLSELADTELRKQAIEQLSERLKEGKQVGRLDLRDLIDSDLNGPRAEFATIEVCNVFLADNSDLSLKKEQYLDGVIQRYLESDLAYLPIEDEMNEIESERGFDE